MECERLLREPAAFIHEVMRRLYEHPETGQMYTKGIARRRSTSPVLLLLRECPPVAGQMGRICLVFNKRSAAVRQPGDLCFPGGRMMPRLDSPLSRLLKIPYFPLARWPYWHHWLSSRKEEAMELAVLLAGGLREAFEEMRLNPLGAAFLGPMQCMRLSLFQRNVYPMVVWIRRQKRFHPNWEVERIIHVPLEALLDKTNYARYRLRFPSGIRDFPCFKYVERNGSEILWGVTYRMVVSFLELVFAFKPPEPEALPVIRGSLREGYLNGAVLSRR